MTKNINHSPIHLNISDDEIRKINNYYQELEDNKEEILKAINSGGEDIISKLEKIIPKLP